MNDVFVALGIATAKPLVAALLLPPVPFVVVVVVGAAVLVRRRVLGWLLVIAGASAIWLTSTSAVADLLTRAWLRPPPPLSDTDIAALRRAPRTAIVVFGAGRRPYAPEYGTATLNAMGVERLRYAMWLARQTSLPVAFSGGAGAAGGPSEAAIAARIADRDFGRPLRWVEPDAVDTRENALRTVALLVPAGVERIVLVTHGYHMRRALANVARATSHLGNAVRVVPAPMGLADRSANGLDDWLPSRDGYERTRLALHEAIGLLAGA